MGLMLKRHQGYWANLIVGLAVLAAAWSCSGDDEASHDDAAVDSSSESSPPAPQTSSPASTTMTTAAPPTSLTIPSPLVPGQFSASFPDVASYTYARAPDLPVPWPQLGLPEHVEGVAVGIRADGLPIGSLVVAEFPLVPYVDQLFDRPIQIQRDTAEHGDELVIVTNDARAVWRPFGGIPVVSATVPDGGVGQWVWEHDELNWIAVGSLAMEGFITEVIAQQQAAQPSDPFDYQLLAGPLYRELDEVPGYRFVDLQVAEALNAIPNTFSGDCAQRLYVGYVEPVDDAGPQGMAPDDLGLVSTTIGGTCVDGGFFDNLDAALRGLPNMRDDIIAGVPVRRNESNIFVIDGDNVLHLSSSDPATFLEMGPFIAALISGERTQPVVDFSSLTVGTCLFRAAPRSADPEDRPVYVTDCATPHQGEIFHTLVLEGPPGAAYPGDAAVSTLANQLCVNAFAGYVGIDFASSRLNFLYFYPSSDSWPTGDRSVVCIVYGSEPEELFRGSVHQTGQ